MTSPTTATRFGEVVEASVQRLVAQCHQLYESPALGTLVRAGDADGGQGAVYGVVSGVETSSLDPSRRAVARGADAASEEEVYRQHPQLEQLLRTDVTIAVLGHANGTSLTQYLPPLPPRVHTFIYICAAEEVRIFTERLEFRSLLTSMLTPTGDDVLAAVLRQASTAHERPNEFLVRAGRAVASLLGGDMPRLNAVLQRLPL